MNLLLNNLLQFNQQAERTLNRATQRKRIAVTMLDDDRAYARIYTHPEDNGTKQICFTGEPEVITVFDEKPF